MQTQSDLTAALDDHVRAELLPELEIVRPLGSGATSNVYLARETALQRLIAVKVLRPAVAADPLLRQRFEREAQSAARIAHPHVTAIYRVGRLSDGVPYIVMEYVEGRTLADVINTGVVMPVAQARAILGSVASALAAAHDRGIVHRDVRPDNVLLDRNGRAVLGDFGIAGLLESGTSPNAKLTAAGVRLGDARYMSPEQIRGEPALEQSDVYSFGILACELLSGSGPYQAVGDAQLMAAHLQQEPRKLRELRADVEAPLAAVIDSCLARDPNRRPLAREVAEKLASAASPTSSPPSAPTGGAEASTLEHFMHELKRRRVYQVVVAYGAVALAALGLSQSANDAALMSSESYRTLVAVVLAGFPIVVVLSWLYDVRRGGIVRTRSRRFTGKMRLLIGLALVTVIIAATLAAWLMMRGTS